MALLFVDSWSGSLWHRIRSIASRQNARAIAQLDEPARILRYAATIDRPGDRQVVMPVNDLFLAGALAAFFKQLNGIPAFAHDASLCSPMNRAAPFQAAGRLGSPWRKRPPGGLPLIALVRSLWRDSDFGTSDLTNE
jgi:hypothetical protein